MRQLVNNRFLSIVRKNINKVFNPNESLLGRWNLNDNREIKGTLANMDSCGDSLCGSPKEYTESISTILKVEDSK